MDIDDLLFNMSEADIAEYFLSKGALEVFHVLRPELLKPTELRKLVSKQIPHDEMLRDKTMRRGLINKLLLNDAKDLATHLGVKTNTDEIYADLLKLTFVKNSDRERKLFEFFKEEIPSEFIDAPKPDQEKVHPERGLFDYQRKALDEIKKILDDGGHRCLLHMPTGSGKTRTAMRAVTALFENGANVIIWLAYSEELCEQAIEEFKEAWKSVGNRPIRISRFFGSHNSDILETTKNSGGDFIVAGLGKMHNARKDAVFLTTLADRVQLVVIDEAHQAVADTYKEILDRLIGNREETQLLGLSATPGRTWNMPGVDAELTNFFNRKKVTLDEPGGPIKFLMEKGYIAKPAFIPIKYKNNLSESDIKQFNSDLEISKQVLDKLAEDTKRNIEIIGEIKKLIKKGHKRIIVFSANVVHAKTISLILANECRTYFLHSGTSRSLRDRIINDYKTDDDAPKIICNFGVLTTGFDAPRTSAAVIARPTKSLVLYSQMIGRAIRGPKVGGNKKCTILTITDINLPGFRNVVEAFNNWEDVW